MFKQTTIKIFTTGAVLKIGSRSASTLASRSKLWTQNARQHSSQHSSLISRLARKCSSHGPIKEWTADIKMAPIHSYENCSMAQGNIKERFGSASWAPIHTLVRDVPDAEIFAFSSIVCIVASRTSTLALLTDEEHHCRRLSLDSAAICLAGRRQTLLRRRRNL